MKTQLTKLIKLQDDVYEELKELGKYGETMSEIVGKCVQAYKKENKIKK